MLGCLHSERISISTIKSDRSSSPSRMQILAAAKCFVSLCCTWKAHNVFLSLCRRPLTTTEPSLTLYTFPKAPSPSSPTISQYSSGSQSNLILLKTFFFFASLLPKWRTFLNPLNRDIISDISIQKTKKSRYWSLEIFQCAQINPYWTRWWTANEITWNKRMFVQL